EILHAELDDARALLLTRHELRQPAFWFVLVKFVAVISRIFLGLQLSGKDKLPKHGPFILSPNHQSFHDDPVVVSQLPWRLFKQIFFVSTSEIFGQGIFGWLSMFMRMAPVDAVSIS